VVVGGGDFHNVKSNYRDAVHAPDDAGQFSGGETGFSLSIDRQPSDPVPVAPGVA
jgi:hypothetical protein